MARRPPKRDTELSGRAPVRKKLLDVLAEIEKGFTDQRQRADDILDNWDIYNQKLGDRQVYNGDSQLFLPYVTDAVDARGTRFLNQVFPQSGRYVDVTTTDGTLPHATMSLLEHYVRASKLRTQVMPAMLVCGDVEGQYNLYVGWETYDRQTVRREEVADVRMKGMPDDAFAEMGTHDEYIEDHDVVAGPEVEVVNDADVLILPATCNSVDQAIKRGGSVTIFRRWTKARIREMIADGDIVEDEGEALLKDMQKVERGQKDIAKTMADAAGIRAGGKEAWGYETWSNVKVEGEYVLVRAYFGGDKQILGCKRCPYWCERVPLLSVPVKKVNNVVKGRAPVAKVADLQIYANDTINEAADTSHMSAMPIIMTDPEKNPNLSSLVLAPGAVWSVDPRTTQFASMPELWKSGMERAEAIKGQIFQTLGVNPAMMPMSSGKPGAKRNQAEIANEQMVDILTTADAVTVIEEGVLTPLLERFALYDHQFRDEDITVRAYGQLGLEAQMQDVPPIQIGTRWEFKWFGVEAARTVAQMQQQIALINVVKGLPPDSYQGYRLNLVPVIKQAMENQFGPRLAPLVFEEQTPITFDPMLENEMLEHGHIVKVNPADDDMGHIQAHMQAQAETQDPHGTIREHIAAHLKQVQEKQMAMQQQAMKQGGLPGSPGGAGPGVAGAPAPGAQPGTQRGMKGPPGAIHRDAQVLNMPRKM
jgi:hypothetical protein